MIQRANLSLIVLLLLLALMPDASAAASGQTTAEAYKFPPAKIAWRMSAIAPSRQRQEGTRPLPFLTLPFTDARVVVHQGWKYTWGSENRGLDYALGRPGSGKGESFDVVAAADGWACGNCVNRQGNAVWIRHQVDGQTYYTYYGHLASIEQGIPIGNQKETVSVKRGQKIGVSGSTGTNIVHLHFQVSGPAGAIDPYDLWTTYEPYAPGCAACRMGENHLWTTNPPSLPSAAPPTEKERSCAFAFGETAQGTISDAAPEIGYCFSATAGDWASVRMFAEQGSPLDTYLKLYAPDGKLLATDDDGAQVAANSFLVIRLPDSGSYKLIATRFAGAGSFRLRIERGAKGALGDLNGDCVVDRADIALMATALANRDLAADLNLSGTVDSEDQTIQAYRLGRGCMAALR